MDKALIQAKAEAAKQRLTHAEDELDLAMRALQGGPRAAKVGVSKLVQDAFSELRAAKADVAEVLRMLGEDEDGNQV